MTQLLASPSRVRPHSRSSRKQFIKSGLVRLMRLSGVKLGTPGSTEVVQVLSWLISQQELILTRFPIEQNDQHTLEGIDPDSYWSLKLAKFIHRADLLGFDSPEGRQAIGELTATCLGLMASILRVYGPIPNQEPPARVFRKAE